MPRKQFKPIKFVSFIGLTDDVDELLELLSQADSLNVRAENELKLRKSERTLITDKLKVVRQRSAEPHITDHAIVRYLERVVGMDIESCKKDMLSKLPEDFRPSSKTEFVNILVDGLRYVVRENLIISVTPIEPKSADAPQSAHQRPQRGSNRSKGK